MKKALTRQRQIELDGRTRFGVENHYLPDRVAVAWIRPTHFVQERFFTVQIGRNGHPAYIRAIDGLERDITPVRRPDEAADLGVRTVERPHGHTADAGLADVGDLPALAATEIVNPEIVSLDEAQLSAGRRKRESRAAGVSGQYPLGFAAFGRHREQSPTIQVKNSFGIGRPQQRRYAALRTLLYSPGQRLAGQAGLGLRRIFRRQPRQAFQVTAFGVDHPDIAKRHSLVVPEECHTLTVRRPGQRRRRRTRQAGQRHDAFIRRRSSHRQRRKQDQHNKR